MALFRWVLATILGVLTLYLVGVNTALNLPATRGLLNDLQPEQFSVTWKRAWSLYPLRVEIVGLAADGQTPTEQWQVDAGRAAASVSLLPLLRGEIRVHDLDLADIDLRLRPRPKPDAEANELVQFYPIIRNRDPGALAEPQPESTGGTLVLEIDDLHVEGEHAFWVSHIRGSLPGVLRGSFGMDTGAGKLSVSGGALDLALASIQVGPDELTTDGAAVKGEIEIPPFAISETQGLELLRLPELDAQVDLPVQNLDLLARLLPQLDALELGGQGRLRGRAILSGGELLRGTDLILETHELTMHLGAYRFGGDGSIEFLVDPQNEAQADLTVRFDGVRAELASGGTATADPPPVLFSGQGLVAELRAAEKDPNTTSDAQAAPELLEDVDLSFRLTIPSMQVEDLRVYNRLFPDDWDLHLLGGTGTLSGVLELDSEAMSLEFDLASDEADLRLADSHATTDLLLQLRAAVASRGGSQDSATLDMTGTLLRLDDGALAAGEDDGRDARASSMQFRITQSDLGLPVSPEEAEAGAISAVLSLLSEKGFGALLTTARGGVSAELSVSQIDWIAELLKRPLGLGLGGAGVLDVEIALREGLPAVGSSLQLPRSALSVVLLDHQIDGTGEVSVILKGADDRPDAQVAIAFEDGHMHRRDESAPSVGEVRMDTEIFIRDPFGEAAQDAASNAELSLAIHSARVFDMSTYNPYLPPHGPVSFLGGEASLVGDLKITPTTAAGEMLLLAQDMRLAVAEEELTGTLRADVLIRDGSGEDLRFDISNSSLLLDGVRVTGPTTSTTDEDWRAHFQFEDAEVSWEKPMRLAMKAELSVKDTRPFVAVLDNLREKHDWIGELLTLEDLGGHLVLRIDGEEAILEDAMISAPEMGIHAKGRFEADGREAMLLLRWHDLSAAVELHNQDKHFDLGDAYARFDAYRPGQTPLPFQLRHAAHRPVSSGPDRASSASQTEMVTSSPQAPSSTELENRFLNDDL